MTFESDPLKHIPSALLNSADIQEYQDRCELLRGEPFEKLRLKSASYEICCKGDVFWSDHEDRLKHHRIIESKPFVLEKNQIAYLSPDVVFYLPDYIAARFNLTISLVHKGLLLGTGPMVDPGFQGRLLVPVHNLTSSEVHLSASEGFIWVEFTKLSPHPARSGTGELKSKFDFVPFPEKKRNRSIETYFQESGGVPRRSSLQETLRVAVEAANRANESQKAAVKQEERLRRRVRWTTALSVLGTIAGLAIAVATLGWATYSFWAQSVSIVRDAQEWATDSKKDREKEMRDLKSRIESLEKRLGPISKPATSSQKASAKSEASKE